MEILGYKCVTIGGFRTSLEARLEVQLECISLVGKKNKNLCSDRVSFIILSAEVSYDIDERCLIFGGFYPLIFAIFVLNQDWRE